MGSNEKIPKPSSNWLALQKKLASGSSSKSRSSATAHVRKKRKVHHTSASREPTVITISASAESSFIRGKQPIASTSTTATTASISISSLPDAVKNGESLSALRKMILDEVEYSAHQQQPGKYLALDCEMVGVGPDGQESSLARVSLVNYHGAVIMDEFVRQRERVVDYRTEWSGIRPTDMINAKPFAEVQEKVAELLKDRILIGHAVHNDLKALLLSHPRPQTRDTQLEARKHKLTKSSRPALRHLVHQELGLTIQSGEHSSVTDARATMAIYRLHRKEWEKGHISISTIVGKKRKRIASSAVDDHADDTEDEEKAPSRSSTPKGKAKENAKEYPGGGRKGISSGLSTVVKRKTSGPSTSPSKKTQWWKDLGNGTNGSKGSLKLKAG